MNNANLLKNDYARDQHFIFEGMKRLPGQLSGAIISLKNRLVYADNKSEAVKLFYVDFKTAYEEKNDALLMSYLSDDWEAGDGTTLYDVEEYFRNMFTVFDEIRLEMTNFQVQKQDEKIYRVSYDLLITGRIYNENMTHEEKSSVTEEVIVLPDKKIKISRTPQGRFWYVN